MKRGNEEIVPDLLLNPLGLLARQTMGQIFQMVANGGKDYDQVYNCQGVLKKGKCLVGPVFYFLINYLSDEHLYVAVDCTKDMITHQPVKGRLNRGGMKAGGMEVFNGFYANKLIECFKEKLSGDFVFHEGMYLPKSALLCAEDAKFFKCSMILDQMPLIKEIN